MLNFKTVNSVFSIILISLICFSFYFPIPFYFYLLIGLIWLILTAIGSFNILLNYFLKAHHSNKNCATKSVAITFDDGPNKEFTPKALELLKKYNAKATFFCIGKNVEQYPNIANQIVDEGHVIANHSFNHSTNFGFLSTKKVVEEINNTNNSIFRITKKQVSLFRPPFGVTNPNIAKAIQKTKHQVIGWNVRSLDTVIKKETKILNRITKKIKAGDIILLHDTSEKTITVLEQLLLFLKEQKITAITVDELLNIKAYE